MEGGPFVDPAGAQLRHAARLQRLRGLTQPEQPPAPAHNMDIARLATGTLGGALATSALMRMIPHPAAQAAGVAIPLAARVLPHAANLVGSIAGFAGAPALIDAVAPGLHDKINENLGPIGGAAAVALPLAMMAMRRGKGTTPVPGPGGGALPGPTGPGPMPGPGPVPVAPTTGLAPYIQRVQTSPMGGGAYNPMHGAQPVHAEVVTPVAPVHGMPGLRGYLNGPMPHVEPTGPSVAEAVVAPAVRGLPAPIPFPAVRNPVAEFGNPAGHLPRPSLEAQFGMPAEYNAIHPTDPRLMSPGQLAPIALHNNSRVLQQAAAMADANLASRSPGNLMTFGLKKKVDSPPSEVIAPVEPVKPTMRLAAKDLPAIRHSDILNALKIHGGDPEAAASHLNQLAESQGAPALSEFEQRYMQEAATKLGQTPAEHNRVRRTTVKPLPPEESFVGEEGLTPVPQHFQGIRQDLFESLAKGMERQLAGETDPKRRMRIVKSIMIGEPREVKDALKAHLENVAPDIHDRILGRTSSPPAELPNVVADLASQQIEDQLPKSAEPTVLHQIPDTKKMVAKPPVANPAEHVLAAMDQFRDANKGALIGSKELREATGLDKPTFDQAVYELAKSQRVMPHKHDFATSLPPDELAHLVDSSIGDPSRAGMHANEGRYWVGVAKNPHAPTSEPAGKDLKQQIRDLLSRGAKDLRDIRHETGHKDIDPQNPLANPVNKAIVEMRDAGELTATNPQFGSPMISLNKQTAPSAPSRPSPITENIGSELEKVPDGTEISVQMNDGTAHTGILKRSGGMPFIDRKGDEPLVLKEGMDLDHVTSITPTRTTDEVLAQKDAKKYGEIVYKQPTTRDEYESTLWDLAKKIHESRENNGGMRTLQLESQFDKVANEIGLARTKRKYMLVAGDNGKPATLPHPENLYASPVDAQALQIPKPTDFHPDPMERRRKSPRPVESFDTKAGLEASLRDAKYRLKSTRMSASRRARYEAIVAKREKQLRQGHYREAQEELQAKQKGQTNAVAEGNVSGSGVAEHPNGNGGGQAAAPGGGNRLERGSSGEANAQTQAENQAAGKSVLKRKPKFNKVNNDLYESDDGVWKIKKLHLPKQSGHQTEAKHQWAIIHKPTGFTYDVPHVSAKEAQQWAASAGSAAPSVDDQYFRFARNTGYYSEAKAQIVSAWKDLLKNHDRSPEVTSAIEQATARRSKEAIEGHDLTPGSHAFDAYVGGHAYGDVMDQLIGENRLWNGMIGLGDKWVYPTKENVARSIQEDNLPRLKQIVEAIKNKPNMSPEEYSRLTGGNTMWKPSYWADKLAETEAQHEIYHKAHEAYMRTAGGPGAGNVERLGKPESKPEPKIERLGAAVSPKDHVAVYNGKAVPVGSGDAKDQFKRAAQRIVDNGASGHVVTPDGKVYAVSPSSKMAKLVTGEEAALALNAAGKQGKQPHEMTAREWGEHEHAKEMSDQWRASAAPMLEEAWKKGTPSTDAGSRVLTKKQVMNLIDKHQVNIGGAPSMRDVDRGEFGAASRYGGDYWLSKVGDQYMVVQHPKDFPPNATHERLVHKAITEGKITSHPDYPKLSAPGAAGPAPSADPRIAEILAASRRPLPEIREVFKLKGDDGKWYSPLGVPRGVTTTDEKKSVGFVFSDKNGTTYGQPAATREELIARHNEQQDRNAEDLRSHLTSEEKIASQHEYWMKEKAKEARLSGAPSPAPAPAKDRQGDLKAAIEAQGGHEANSVNDIEAIRRSMWEKYGSNTPTPQEIRSTMDQMRVEQSPEKTSTPATTDSPEVADLIAKVEKEHGSPLSDDDKDFLRRFASKANELGSPLQRAIPSLEERQADHAKWVKDVRDPARAASEGEKTITTGKGATKSEVGYEIAPLPDGRVAVRSNFSKAGKLEGRGNPWETYASREEALGSVHEAGQKFFAGDQEMLAKLQDIAPKAKPEQLPAKPVQDIPPYKRETPTAAENGPERAERNARLEYLNNRARDLQKEYDQVNDKLRSIPRSHTKIRREWVLKEETLRDRARQLEVERDALSHERNLESIEDQLQAPKSREHYTKLMADFHEAKRRFYNKLTDRDRRREMGIHSSEDLVKKIDFHQQESDKHALELIDQIKSKVPTDKLNKDEIQSVAEDVYRDFNERSDLDRSIPEAVQRRLGHRAQYGHTDIDKLKHLDEAAKQTFKDDLNKATERGPDWFQHSKDIIAKAEAENKRLGDVAANKAKLEAEERQRLAEIAQANSFREGRESNRSKLSEPRYFEDVDRRSKDLKGTIEKVPTTGPIDENTERVLEREVLNPTWEIVKERTKDDKGKMTTFFTLKHTPSGLNAVYDTNSKNVKKFLTMLEDQGVDLSPYKTGEEVPKEVAQKLSRIQKAWNDSGLHGLNEEEQARALGKMSNSASSGINADMVLGADDLGYGHEGKTHIRAAKINPKIKQLAEEVPEFAYNPVFTVSDKKTLVFRDGYKFEFDPEAFNIHASELKPGQTVGINLGELGIKQPSPPEVVAGMLKNAGWNNVKVNKGGGVSASLHPGQAATMFSGDGESWHATGKHAKEGYELLKGIRWKQPGQDEPQRGGGGFRPAAPTTYGAQDVTGPKNPDPADRLTTLESYKRATLKGVRDGDQIKLTLPDGKKREMSVADYNRSAEGIQKEHNQFIRLIDKSQLSGAPAPKIESASAKVEKTAPKSKAAVAKPKIEKLAAAEPKPAPKIEKLGAKEPENPDLQELKSQFGPAPTKQATVKIGENDVKGLQIGQFLVHKKGKEFDVTHIPTGLSAGTSPNQEEGLLRANLLNARGKWDFTDSSQMDKLTSGHATKVNRLVQRKEWGELKDHLYSTKLSSAEGSSSARKPGSFRVGHDAEGNMRGEITLPDGTEINGAWREDVPYGGGNSAEAKFADRALSDYEFKLRKRLSTPRNSDEAKSQEKWVAEQMAPAVKAVHDTLNPGTPEHAATYNESSGHDRKYRIEPRYSEQNGLHYVNVYDIPERQMTGNVLDGGEKHSTYAEAATHLGEHLERLNTQGNAEPVIHDPLVQKAHAEQRDLKIQQKSEEHAAQVKADQEAVEHNRREGIARAAIDEIVSKAKGTKSKIMVRDEDGKELQQVDGTAYGDMAVQKMKSDIDSRKDVWRVAHVHTGMLFPQEFPTASAAKEVAVLAGMKGDWSFTSQKKADPEAITHAQRLLRAMNRGEYSTVQDLIKDTPKIEKLAAAPKSEKPKIERLGKNEAESDDVERGGTSATYEKNAKLADHSPEKIDYTPDLKITNLDQLPKGSGAGYLVALKKDDGQYIAKEWRRSEPGRGVKGEVVIRFPEGKQREEAGRKSSTEYMQREREKSAHAASPIVNPYGDTPAGKAYVKAKTENPGSIVLLRRGDTYEMFGEDAERASKALGLTLSHLDKTSKNPIAMAGMSRRDFDAYRIKLLNSGHHVVVTE